MKKVLFVAHNHPALQPGGAEGHALDLHEALEEGGRYEPIFLARAERTPQRHTRIPIGSVDGRKGHYLMYTEWNNWDFMYGRSSDRSVATRFFRDFLLGQRPDIVHFQHTRFLGYDMVRVARNTLPDAPIVYTLHEYMPICHRDGPDGAHERTTSCARRSLRGAATSASREITPQDFFMRKALHPVPPVARRPASSRRASTCATRYVDWGIPAETIEVEPYARPPVSVAPDSARRTGPATGSRSSASSTLTRGPTCCCEAMELLGRRLRRAPLDPRREPRDPAAGVPGRVQRPARADARDRHLRRPLRAATELREADGEDRLGVVPSIWWETGRSSCWRPSSTAGR